MFFTDRRTTHSDIFTDLNDDERIPVLFDVPADTTQSSTPFFDNEPSNTLDLDLGADPLGADQDDDLPDGSQSGSGLDIALANMPEDAGLEPISIETGIVESQPQGQPENIGSDITLSSSSSDSTPPQSPDDDPSEGTDLPDNGEPEAVNVWNAPDATPIDFPIVNISTGQEVHLETCACAGCSMRPEPIEPSTDSATLDEATVDSAASPLGDLADFLREGYWGGPGNQRSHNVSSSGTDPNNGVLHYNVTNNGDSPYVDDPNGLTEDRKVLVREAFKIFEQTLGITFVETTSTDTTFTDFFFSDNDSGAYAGSYVSGNTITRSYINVSESWSGGTSTYDDYTLQTILHEIGHALGLGHQGDYNGSATYGTSNDFENDSWQASMMSYFSQTENPTISADYELLQTPMSVDWMALDDLYGAQTSSTGQTFGTENAFTGDTVYGFNTNITSQQSDIWFEYKDWADRTASTIVDTGGIDTLDVSGYTANQLINLRETTRTDTAPSASNIGGRIGNLTLAEGTIIENAKGGSGSDTFFGNSADNSFWGNGGDDTFNDSLGSDTYYGGAGTNDTVKFFDAFSNFVFEVTETFLSVINVATSAIVDLVENTIEFLNFSGVTKTFQEVSDSAGTALPSVTITEGTDDVGPVQEVLTSGSVTDDTDPVLTGTVSAALETGQTVSVFVNGSLSGEATIASDGTSWSYSVAGLAEGSYTFTARVEATDGTTGPISSGFDLTVDTTAPGGVTTDILTTADTTPVLTGTGDDPTASVSVVVGGQTYDAIVDGSGNWSVEVTTALGEGTFDVEVTATDAAGNSQTVTTTGALTVDPTLGQEIYGFANLNDTLTGGGGNDTISGLEKDSTATAAGTIDILTGGDGDDLFILGLSGARYYDDGNDKSGNSGTNDYAYITDFGVGNDTVQLSGTAYLYEAWTIDGVSGTGVFHDSDDGGSWDKKDELIGFLANTDPNLVVSTPTTDGLTLLTYAGGDDTTPPVVTVNSLTTSDTTPELTGTVDDPTASILVTVNNADYAATNNGDGTWTLADDTIGALTVGTTYEVLVVATDAAGNEGRDASTNELVIEADTTPPVVTVNSLTTSDTTPELTGTVDDPTASILVTVNNADYVATNNGDGTWTLADDTIDALTVGTTYEVLAVATDAAGNEGRDASTDELEITQTVLDAVLYGTEGSDTVTGNDLDNTVWGISQTSAETGSGDTGAATVDTLIGGGGADTFVLGDGSRIFYDDGNDRAGNNGKNDYAFIADFANGTDKIQLSFVSGYLLNTVAGDTEIYRDANGDDAFDSRDELIGIVGGVTLTDLNSSDFTYV